MDDLWGAVLNQPTFDASGNMHNPMLDPDAYSFLMGNGYISAAATVIPMTLEVPYVGQILFAVLVTGYVTYEGVTALHQWFAVRGHTDPAVVRALPNSKDGTRDSNGNCMQNAPPIPNYKWQATNYAERRIHWHWVRWNLNATTCTWYITRGEGYSDPGPDYILIPGIFGPAQP
jgi:hypothetical protein